MTEFVGNRQNVDFADPKTVILADLMCQQLSSVPSKILVVGCEKGGESASWLFPCIYLLERC